MANIKINNLHPVGSDLFQDPESFLNELSDRQIGGVQGGLTLDTLAASAGSASDPLGGLTAGTLGGTLADSISGLTAGTLGLTITPL